MCVISHGLVDDGYVLHFAAIPIHLAKWFHHRLVGMTTSAEILVLLLQLITNDKRAFFNALEQEPAAVVLFFYTGVMLVGLGSLVVYHV